MNAAAENLARWREALDGEVQERSATDDDPLFQPFVFHTSGCDRQHGKREGCNVRLRDQAMPALLAFAEAVLALHAPTDMLHAPSGRVVQVCVACGTERGERSWPCPTVRLAEQHLGGGS